MEATKVAKSSKKSASGGSLAATIRDSVIKTFGSSGEVGIFLENVRGLPLEGNLPLQYLFGIDVLPLGRCLSIVGATSSMKSLFGWYLAGLFMKIGGLVFFIDTEEKTNTDQVVGLLGGDRTLLENHLIPAVAKTLDDALLKMVKLMQTYKNLCPKEDVPCYMMLDSLGAVTSKQSVDNMVKTGEAGNGGFGAARNAATITEQLRAFVPEYINNSSVTLSIINHQKKSMEQPASAFMPTVKTEPGGAHKDFANTFVIEMSSGKDTSTKSFSRVMVSMKTKKSGFSKKNLRIGVNVTHSHSEGKLHVDFDWNETLANMLVGDLFLKEEISNVLHIKKDGAKFSSKTLNISNVSASEMGGAIHANKEIVQGLQEVFHVIRKTAV